MAANVLAIALCCLPRLGAQESKEAVVAGERIGQVRLGMSDEAVEKLLGKPTFGDSHKGEGSDTWTAKSPDGQVEQTQVFTERGDKEHWKVEQVAVTSPFFRTRGGNSTNSGLDAIWREFPNLKAHKGEPWGKCRAVIVHPVSGGVEWTAVDAPLEQGSGG